MSTNRLPSKLVLSSLLLVGGMAIPTLAPADSAPVRSVAAAEPADGDPGPNGEDGAGQVGAAADKYVVEPAENVEFYTAEWTGDRYADGRPKVPDDILERMKNVSIEQAWGYLQGEEYNNQFAGDWMMIHEDQPFVGRALTAQYMPSSPGLEERMTEAGHAAGRDGQMNTWPIAMLDNGDVYVADGYGKVEDGTLIGGNLGTDIYSRTGTGVVFNGSARDLGELDDIEGFNAFVRDWHPSYIKEMMLSGVNVPLRIGEATVLPGDVVLAGREGVVFIPAHLAEDLVKDSEETLLRDTFVKQRLDEGTYTSGQVDMGWDEVAQEIRDDYRSWLEENKDDLPVPAERVQEIIDAT
jgi:4-hydroxy-4-methyl-2-oxoglutarate aldolase